MKNQKSNFIIQQGFDAAQPEVCGLQYSSLQFQPRVVFGLLLLGIVWQSPKVFSGLGAVLWWSALFPKWNPFDHLYNHTMGKQPGALRLSPSPIPRRFAQGMAGTFALLIALSLRMGWPTSAHILEGVFLAAVSALVFGGFCAGSFVYFCLKGQWAFAKRTCPWA